MRKGFTLVELLVVIAVTAMLASFSIIYTHVGQNQIALSVEGSKVAELILQAKQLSIATYSEHATTCAYGVQFDYVNSTYSLFAYDAAANSALYPGRTICPSIASTSAAFDTAAVNSSTVAESSWRVPTAQGVRLKNPANPIASDTIQDVLFYPPDPCTLLSFDGATFQSDCPPDAGTPTGYVYLSTVDGSASIAVSVSPSGQVGL